VIDRLKSFFRITILAPTVLAVGVLFSCTSNKLDEVMAFDEGELQPMRSSTNVTYTYTDSGKVKNVLVATNLDQFQDGDSSYSKISNGFSLTFYTPDGEFDGKLTAQNGYIGNDNSIMIARDSVVFINQANEKLNTEELIWRQDSATVTTDKFVTIEQEDIVIYGKGLWSNQNFTNYVIKEVTGSFYLKENEDESGQ
jgi:LPS export ABC transporter protein LptC